jgi:hypothetical protein
LDSADLELLWGDIYLATRDLSPSGIMFADGVRFSGLKLMQKNGITEGVKLCTAIFSENRWGKGNRQKTIDAIENGERRKLRSIQRYLDAADRSR